MYEVNFRQEDLDELVEELYDYLPFETGEALVLKATFDWLNIELEGWIDNEFKDKEKAKKVVEAIYKERK